MSMLSRPTAGKQPFFFFFFKIFLKTALFSICFSFFLLFKQNLGLHTGYTQPMEICAIKRDIIRGLSGAEWEHLL